MAGCGDEYFFGRDDDSTSQIVSRGVRRLWRIHRSLINFEWLL